MTPPKVERVPLIESDPRVQWWLDRALQMKNEAIRSMRAAFECLEEAKQARLTERRESLALGACAPSPEGAGTSPARADVSAPHLEVVS